MKIALITNGEIGLPSKSGGIETLVTTLIENNTIDSITVFSSPRSKNESDRFTIGNNVKFVYIKHSFKNITNRINNLLYSFSKYLKLKRIIQFSNHFNRKIAKIINNSDFDIVLSENNYRVIDLIKNQKIVFHSHYDDLNNEKDAYLIHFFKQMLNKVSLFICVSDFIKNNILEIFPNKRAITIRNIPRYNFLIKESDKTLLENNNYLAKKKILLYCGRFDYEKGVDILINAFNNLKVKRDDLFLILAGKENESPFWKQTKTLIKNDVLITGFIDNDELYKVYDCADIVVIPSFRVNESSSLVAIESLTRHKKIVFSDSGAISETALLTKNSYRCECVDELEATIEKALNAPYVNEKIDFSEFTPAKYTIKIFNSLKNHLFQ